ncbi:MAG: hypothetical protein QOK43_245 [Acidimicrobiaceae bacterium]|nr:hypothetical protein [Acidimicrobiaceae bacterium]
MTTAQGVSRRAAVLTTVVALVLSLAGACTKDSQSPARLVAERKKVTPVDDTVRFDGVNALACTTQLAVVATVTSVQAPYKTTYTLARDPQTPETSVEKLIQDVDVRVERVAFDNSSATPPCGGRPGPVVSASVGQSLSIAAEQEGDAVQAASGGVIAENQRSGSFAAGDRVFLLLRQFDRFPGPNGSTRRALTLVSGWQGHWTVNGVMAANADGRQAPLEGLIQRLKQEQAKGRHPENDPGTETNPAAPAKP